MARPIRTDGAVAYVTLTQGYEATIDTADIPLVAGWDWQAHIHRREDGSVKAVYAKRGEMIGDKQYTIRMHRVLCTAPDAVDHKDGNGLNNRRYNLRAATARQNAQNRGRSSRNLSGAKGVSRHHKTGKWQARICVAGRELYLGLFACRTAAAIAYASASIAMHGEFGRAA